MTESIHIYQSYSPASQELESKLRVDQMLGGTLGRLIRKYVRMVG